MFLTHLEFRCSDLGDSSCRRNIRTLALNEYKDTVSNMKLRPRKTEY